jgi:diguanylate cyclase (GGDEF)-like protein
MNEAAMEDARASDPVERLLEESWRSRPPQATAREVLVETVAAAVFMCAAVPLAVVAFTSHHTDVPLAAGLVVLYAITSRLIKFPIGAGYVVPSYLVLVPMLLLLPPGTVPLLTAVGLTLGTLGQVAVGRAQRERILFAVPDAWHALGPAVVLLLAGRAHGGLGLALVYGAAFLAGCLLDLASATVREWAILGIGHWVQVRVIALVWLVDACIAPLGLLVAHAMRHDSAEMLLILPLNLVLLLVSRDRNARIEQAQRRLGLVAHERSRLQTAVRRLGEALAAKLDLDALTEIVLRGSVEALDAEAGRLTLSGPPASRLLEIGGTSESAPALRVAAENAADVGRSCQLERHGVWALALPFGFSSDAGQARGAVAVARRERPFRADEQAVMQGLVERAGQAAGDIIAHQLLREQAMTDSLTRLGNRRKLAADLERGLTRAGDSEPLVLMVFDLDGFKSYNDTFGHQAGDAVLARLAGKLTTAVAGHGDAYRLGGDEFCALLRVPPEELDAVVTAATEALQESGENFAVGASYGAVLMPQEAKTPDYALQLADQRMYSRKRGRASGAADQARDVLTRIIHTKQPSLQAHASAVAALSARVGRRLGLSAEELDELVRAAELHDIGKVAIPDAILRNTGALNEAEREFVQQQTVLGERILSAAPALRPIARVVRSTRERWDGQGYPDGLMGEEIPIAARIIAVCDAYAACVRESGAQEHARALLRERAGRRFDPAIVEATLQELRDHSGEGRGAIEAPSGSTQSPGDLVESLRQTIARYASVATAGAR